MLRHGWVFLSLAALAACAEDRPGPSTEAVPALQAAPGTPSAENKCGDGKCEGDEVPATCPADCPLPPTPTASDGCTDSKAAGCNGCACEDCVCDLDPYCCATAWDAQCVAECGVKCGGKCPGTAPSDGCTVSLLPGCDNCGCESCVCTMDPYCCKTAWDAQCVQECTKGCGQECGGAAKCGDGKCQPGESPSSCPADCGELATCLAAECSGEWKACLASAPCWDLMICRGLCGGDSACADGCMTKAPAADQAAFAKLQLCSSQDCGVGLPQGCTITQNTCAGDQLTWCNTKTGKLETTTCSSEKCAASGFGPLLGCQQVAAGYFTCVCQDKGAGEACTTAQNSCADNVLTWCDVQTGKLQTTTCSDALCAQDGFGPLIGCQANEQGVFLCMCQAKGNE